MKNYIYLFIIFIAGLIIGYLLNMNFTGSKEKITIKYDSKVLYDTIIKLQPAKPVILTKIKTKIIVQSDTVIQFHPFISKLDTVVNSDTISTKFEFPQNLFSFDFKKKPDSISIQKMVVYQPVEKKRQWWETPAMILTGAVIGFVAGVLSK